LLVLVPDCWCWCWCCSAGDMKITAPGCREP
jgi:hypothetical protein